MRKVRNEIGGLGNLLFKEAYIWGQMRDGNIPDVYVQSSKYWEKYKEEIKTRFSSGIGFTDRIALHIRRGDYLKVSQFHVNLWDTDYYKEAIKHFQVKNSSCSVRITKEKHRTWMTVNGVKKTYPNLGLILSFIVMERRLTTSMQWPHVRASLEPIVASLGGLHFYPHMVERRCSPRTGLLIKYKGRNYWTNGFNYEDL